MGLPRPGRAALWTGALLGALVLAGWAGPARAQGSRVSVEIVVNHASRSPGPIAPDARELHQRLHSQFRYGSLRVLKRKRVQLRMDEIGSLELPNGRYVRVRPLNLQRDGVLMAVEVEGVLQTDMRMHSHKLAVIGAHPYRDGKLVITLEPSF